MKNIYKWCWVAKEVKSGWKLSLFCNNIEHKLGKALFTKVEEVEMITNRKDGKIVFIHLKDSKYPTK